MAKRALKSNNSFLEIDTAQLDCEWANQPLLAKEYSDRLADAKEQLDKLKAVLEAERAEIDLDVRSNPENYELEKVTEPAIKMAIAADQRIIELETDIRHAKHDVDILSGACNAIEHRKRALEKLVDLWLASYFAEPRARDDVAKEQMGEAVKRSVRSKHRRKRND